MNATQTKHTRLPAFGRRLLELRRSGHVPKPHRWLGHVVVCLDCWKWAKLFTRLVVQRESNIETLDFSLLAGLDVVVAYSPQWTYPPERLTALLKRLVGVDVASLRVVDMEVPSRGFFVKSRAVGLERQAYAL